ncbi:MAG: OmpA family protein [Candidatus Omnitrophica bacterium]|nr:OmpA family protein [Candidatus Omnitrophota bacterium]MCM8770686.1 OmpA family protein [Candidatus Omnitrophota bacterium]
MKMIKPILVIYLSITLAGCTFIFQKGRRSDIEKIETLSQQLQELENTKRLLEERLAKEIADKEVRLEMLEKGLVITFVADILFDSGKAKIRNEAYPILDKVARVLVENVPQFNIGIEGHTDNEPIKYSGWKSNWELSTARALSVLHYLVDEKGVNPERISAIGYGEYKPVATNDTKEGRRLNRRVEVVILPTLAKQKGKEILAEPEENLK